MIVIDAGMMLTFFSPSIIPAVRRNISKVPMFTQFLCDFVEKAPPAGLLDVAAITTITKDLLKEFSEFISLQSSHYRAPPPGPSKRKRNTWGVPLPQTPTPVANAEEARNLAIVIFRYTTLSMPDELEKVTNHLSEHAKIIHIDSFETILVPTLKAIARHLKTGNLSTAGESPFSSLFQSVLASYICRYVQDPPTSPENWTIPKRGCSIGCRDCQALDAFLIDPQERVGSFPMATKRRDHLEGRLDPNECSHTTTRQGIPHTLVVKKTRAIYAAKVSAYRRRHTTANRHIAGLNRQILRALLGDYFNEIFEGYKTPLLEGLCGGPSALTSNSGNLAEPSTERIVPRVPRRKFPGGGTIPAHDSRDEGIEVIDITSD
jgi:hypothetical protein